MPPETSRFESDPNLLVGDDPLPAGWSIGAPDPASPGDVAALARLLREHEDAGRGWTSSGPDDVLVEISEHGERTRQNLVVRDAEGAFRAWASVHDRAGGRMLLVLVIDRSLEPGLADACSRVLMRWAEAQAREVGSARGLDLQQIDTGAFENDAHQHRLLAAAGFTRVRRWWQMSRPVVPEEAGLVPDSDHWEKGGVRFRLVQRSTSGLPDETDLRAVHAVLEEAFTDHFNSREETFAEFVHRLREDPGHRWDHWWLAELLDSAEGGDPEPVGALVGAVSAADDSPGAVEGSYVAYLGVRSVARGRGVASGLLRTVIADAAARGRDRVGLEVDADSSTGADRLYVSMGWKTSYITESWHRDVVVGDSLA